MRVGLITEQGQSEAYAGLLQSTLLNAVITVFGGIAALVLGWSTTRNVTEPIESLASSAHSLAEGDLTQHVAFERNDELGDLARSLNSMTERTRGVLENLESTVVERTAELERRAQYLQAAAEVGQAAAEFYNLDDLLSPITHLISERFGFYHVGIFLIDEKREFARLSAANSEGGYRMLQRGHRLRVGQEGMVGFVTSTGESRVLQSVAGDVIHFDNPDLPYTRSEMTLPLETSGALLGALDVQSTAENAFSDEDVQVLQVLANQVALAINNARLFEQLQASLEAERRVFGELSREAWIELLRGRTGLGVRVDQGGISPADDVLLPESTQAIHESRSIQAAQGPGQGYLLSVPIRIHGDVVIGVLETNKSNESGPWVVQEITIMEQIAEQLGIALENARLFDETQRLAFRERVAADVSGKVWSSSDIETILQTTVQELSRALNASQGRIRLRFPEENGS
jgi:GAF domain-containing protein/HAMP domain-containing protein